MAHETRFLARLYDTINREGFEWLMQPIRHYDYYQVKYRKNYATARYVSRLLLSLLGLPLLSSAYVFTRVTGTILNRNTWANNPLKPVLMTILALGPPLTVVQTVGFIPLMKLISFGITPIGGAITVGVMILSVVTAGLLYLSKKMAQSISDSIDHTKLSLVQAEHLSPKHRLSFHNGLAPMAEAYKALMKSHTKHKQALASPKGLSGKQLAYEEQRVEEGKTMLFAFENLIKSDRDGVANAAELNAIQSNGKKSLAKYQEKIDQFEIKSGRLTIKV